MQQPDRDLFPVHKQSLRGLAVPPSDQDVGPDVARMSRYCGSAVERYDRLGASGLVHNVLDLQQTGRMEIEDGRGSAAVDRNGSVSEADVLREGRVQGSSIGYRNFTGALDRR